MYRLTINSTDKYVNLREKPNGKILEQIPTAKSEEILLLNLNMSLWEVKGVSEWQRQLGAMKGLNLAIIKKLWGENG